MKTKIKNLLARLFAPAAVNEAKTQANVVSSRESELRQAAREREEQRHALLKELYFAVLCHNYREVEELVPTYQGKFGRLTGEERVYLLDSSDDGYGKIDDEIPTFSSYPLLLTADAMMKEFFFALVEGKNPDTAAYQAKWNLQKKLLEAVESGDVLAVDALLKQGADINYAYYSPYVRELKLWHKVPPRKSNPMYRYFMSREDCPEAAALKANQEATEKLLCERGV